MSVVGFIRRLTAAGVDLDTALIAAEAFEAEAAEMLSAGAKRTRRWREKVASQASHVTVGDAGDGVSPEPKGPPDPLKNSTSSHPPSPPKGGSSPTRISPSKAELDAIWEITPKIGRERSSRKDLERSLTAAMRRGHDPTSVKTGLEAAYASPSFSGDHAKGVHRLIENDRWQSFTEDVVAKNSSLARIEALVASGYYART